MHFNVFVFSWINFNEVDLMNNFNYCGERMVIALGDPVSSGFCK